MSDPQRTRQPAWVDILDEAKTALRDAVTVQGPTAADSKIRLAYAWMDLAKILRGDTMPR